jgi:hypothetical protein
LKYQLLSNSRLVLPPNESYLVWVLSGQHLPEGSCDHIGSPAIGLAKEMSIDIERDGYPCPRRQEMVSNVHARGDKL